MIKYLVFMPLFCLLMFTSEKKAEMTHCGSMVKWANEKDFQEAHKTPLSFKNSDDGIDLVFITPDGTDGMGYIIPAKSKTNKWLFVYQEWWGLNDYIKNQSDKLYKDLNGEVNVLAIDLYDGKIAENAQEAGKFMGEVKEDRLKNIIEGALGYAGPDAKIVSIGWCFGGSWSLKSALIGGEQSVGAVMYYGMPVNEVEKLKTLNCDVLGVFATEKWISKEVIEEFAKNMKQAGKKLDYTVYPAEHAFANPSNPKYNKELAGQAYATVLPYIKSKF